MGKKKVGFEPMVVYDAVGYMRQFWLAAECKDDIVWYICSDTTRHDLFVRGAIIGQIGPVGAKTRLIISDRDPNELALKFKKHALKWGATPEAIRLLGIVTPLTEEEESTMAKLARKEELKEAAKAAPVGGKRAAASAAPKTNGGAEKLREAAEGKRAAFAAQKLTVLVKPSDTTLRGGRLAKLEFVHAAKPKKVGDVLGETFEHEGKEIVIDAGALRGMEKREHISID